MNFRLTLALSFILLVIAGMMLYFKPWEAKPATMDESTKNLLISPAPENLQKLTYAQEGTTKVGFEKQGDNWIIIEPVKAKAEKWQIDDLARTLKDMHYREKFEPEATGYKSASATGTDSPKDVVTVEDDKGKNHTLGFGKRTVDGIYATLDGAKTIYLLESNPLDRLDRDAQEFRDKSIQTVKDEDIRELIVQRADEKITLAKSDGKWLIQSPITARANAATVQEILNEFRNINASKFSTLLTKDAPATGLAPPLLSVTAMVEESPSPATTAPAATQATTQKALKPVTLQLGYYVEPIAKKSVYASMEGSKDVFTYDAKSFDKINRELKDLRDPSITPAPVTQASDLTIMTGNTTSVAATKKDGKWMLTSTAMPLSADAFAINDFLGALKDEKAIKYVDHAGDLKSIGLDPPETKIELTLPGQSQREVILVGKPETADKVTPMMRQGEPTVFLVQTPEAEKLKVSNLHLRDKTVEALKGDEIREIAISGPGAANGGNALEREGMHWNIKQGDKIATADETKVSSFLADFTPLSAAKYLEDKAPTGDPTVMVKLTIVEPVQAATTAPATSPATAPATGPATMAATMPALPTVAPMGPDAGKTVTRELKLYRQDANGVITWRAAWDNQQPTWAFQPTQALIDHVTKESFASPTTQPATAPATNPG